MRINFATYPYIFSTTLQLKTIFRWTLQKQLNTLSEGVPVVQAISDLSRKIRFFVAVISHQFLFINESLKLNTKC